jgi:hypothetical protein
MTTPRLPLDYARCTDSEACPFKDVCKRHLTKSYDISGEGHYSYANFYAAIGKTPEGDPYCASRIVWEG